MSRDLVITQNITLDGVVEAADDWFGIAGREGSDDLDAVLAAQRDASDGFLAGRGTFESMREFWGPQTDDPTGVTDHLNRVHKYVLSTTLGDPGWEPTTVLRDLGDVRAIKDTDGGDIVCTGSTTVCRALAAAGLVDEYRLFVFPYARGSGGRLFDGTPPTWLRLVETTSFRSGAILLRYRTD